MSARAARPMKGGPLALAASVLAHALAAALWVHQPAPVPAVRAPLHVVLEDAAPAARSGTRVEPVRFAHPEERLATAPVAPGMRAAAPRTRAVPVAAARIAPMPPADAPKTERSGAAHRLGLARAPAPGGHSTAPPATAAPPAAAGAVSSHGMHAASAAEAATEPAARGTRASRTAAELPPELALALGRHFRYPWAARRQGLEGEVRVRFAVNGGGGVAPAGLARSSGYDLLDRAALAGLAQLARAEHLPGLGGRTVELPVRYRLQRQP